MNKNRMLMLQLFAEPNPKTQTTTSSGMTPEMKTYYEKRLIDQAEPQLVHDQFGDKYPIPANGGKSIEFRKFASLPKATTPLTEGVTPDGQEMSVSTITANVKQYGMYISISDILDMTSIDNVVVQATGLNASQAGRTLDTITREILAAGTNVMYAPKVVSDEEVEVTSRASLDKTAKVTPDLVFKAVATLKACNAQKIDGDYVAIVHPYVAYDIMRDYKKEWIDVHKYASAENIYEGEIGKLGGCRFVETTESKIWKDDTCPEGLAVFGTLILGAHAYGVTELANGGLESIIKGRGEGNDPLNQRSTCAWKATKTAEILVDEYMIRLESCSSFSDKVNAAN